MTDTPIELHGVQSPFLSKHDFFTQFIAYLESTSEDDWCCDVVRSSDGSKNCVFGHLFRFVGDDMVVGNALADWFEWHYTSTFAGYRVNDGEDDRYLQPTPKQRCLAYLQDIHHGRVMSTQQYMDSQCAISMGEQLDNAHAAS